MAFYYVKTGGTATGDAGRSETARVGSFASMGVGAYYNSVYDVFAGLVPTTAPDGDNILVSNAHSEEHTTITLGVASVTNYKPQNIVSVSDGDIGIESKGAVITCTSGGMNLGSNVNFKSGYIFKGFSFNCQFGNFSTYNRYSQATFFDSDINGSSVTTLSMAKSTCINTNITGKIFSGTSLFKAIGGSISVTWSYAFATSLNVILTNVDLTGGNGSASKFSYGCVAKLTNCKIPTYPPVKYSTYRPTDSVEYIGCDIGDGYYHYANLSFVGEVVSNKNIHLNYKYDDVSSLSFELNSNSSCVQADPLKHKLCEIPAQDLSISDKTYRVNILLNTDTVATLTDANCWVDVSHNDNVDLALGKIVSSRNADILAIGTELTTSAEAWQGALPINTKAYQVDITLNAASLPNVTNGNVEIYVNLAIPNADVYVCPAVQIGV